MTVRLLSAGSAIAIEVEDDGPGIPGPDRAAVLGRFRRARPESGPESGPDGMGLGLPVVSEIAMLFGGRLELSHAAEKGGKTGLCARILLPEG